MENISQPSVIGKHNDAQQKRQRIGAIALIILGVLLIAIGAALLIAVENASGPAVMLIGLGIICAIPGIITLMVALKLKKANGTPIILLNDDNTLTLILGKNKEQKINIADISKVKFIPRLVVEYWGFMYRYSKQTDGTIKIYMNNGAKYKVKCVDEGQTVTDLINSYKK